MNLPNPFPGMSVNVSTAVQISKPTITNKIKYKKAGKNGTLISVILDESGSMQSCVSTTIAGFNEFVAGQKAAESTAGLGYLTLIKFDAPNIKTVFNNRPLSEVPKLTNENYKPNGGTNLLDAVGHAIEEVSKFLGTMSKSDRPGVIITIITDGEENSSRKYNNAQIKEMVAAAEKADYSFVYLAANIDAFKTGSAFGMNLQNSVSYSTENMSATMASVSASTTRMRSSKMAGLDTNTIYQTGLYTSEELSKMKGQ